MSTDNAILPVSLVMSFCTGSEGYLRLLYIPAFTCFFAAASSSFEASGCLYTTGALETLPGVEELGSIKFAYSERPPRFGGSDDDMVEVKKVCIDGGAS